MVPEDDEDCMTDRRNIDVMLVEVPDDPWLGLEVLGVAVGCWQVKRALAGGIAVEVSRETRVSSSEKLLEEDKIDFLQKGGKHLRRSKMRFS